MEAISLRCSIDASSRHSARLTLKPHVILDPSSNFLRVEERAPAGDPVFAVRRERVWLTDAGVVVETKFKATRWADAVRGAAQRQCVRRLKLDVGRRRPRRIGLEVKAAESANRT